MIELEKCVCGQTPRERIGDNGLIIVVCACGRAHGSVGSTTDDQVRRKWNLDASVSQKTKDALKLIDADIAVNI